MLSFSRQRVITIFGRQGKALAVLSGVAFFYACFGMAASAIHAKITAKALPCPPDDIYGSLQNKFTK